MYKNCTIYMEHMRHCKVTRKGDKEWSKKNEVYWKLELIWFRTEKVKINCFLAEVIDGTKKRKISTLLSWNKNMRNYSER